MTQWRVKLAGVTIHPNKIQLQIQITNDNSQNCGGYAVSSFLYLIFQNVLLYSFFQSQYPNGGLEMKCGVCGDIFDERTPRSHELGGKFGQGVIVKTYPANGQIYVRIPL